MQEADSVNVGQSAVTISPRLHFCFALHAEDGPATLAWLQHNVLWRSRGLEWIASHPLKNSAPEGHSLPSPTPARAVQLITASAHCEAELAGALDATIVKVGSTEQHMLCTLFTFSRGLAVWPDLRRG